MKGTRVNMTTRQAKEFTRLNPMLREIFLDLMEMWPTKTLTITCIGRTKEEDKALGASGVHSTGEPWRAIDVRIRTLPDYQNAADEMADVLNSTWEYDPVRPGKSVAVSKLHGTGPHIHLQCHPRTKPKSVN